jgi:hypothetical protein
MVEKGGSIAQVMRSVGYSDRTARTPQKLTESKGFQEICKKSGLTPGLITRALVADIKKKPQRRVKELSLGAEILKMKDDAPQVNIVNIAAVLNALEDGQEAGR